MQALLVIDMLEDFLSDGPLLDQRPSLVRNLNQLIDHCRSKAVPVIWVRQEFKADLSDAFLVMKKHNIPNAIEGTPGLRFFLS